MGISSQSYTYLLHSYFIHSLLFFHLSFHCGHVSLSLCLSLSLPPSHMSAFFFFIFYYANERKAACVQVFSDGSASRSSSTEQVYIAPPPLVVKVENAFRPVKSPSLTFSIKNYDGSETHRTISQDSQGEVVTELTVSSDGSLVGSIAKGKF